MDINNNKLYKNAEFQDFTEDVLRPGGLELTAKAVALAGFVKGSSLLDIGCGLAKTVEFLQDNYAISGIDISSDLIAKAKSRNPALNVVVGDAYNLLYPQGSLDGVLTECVMSLLMDRKAALSEIKRVLKADGRLTVSDLYIRESTREFTGLPLVTCINGMKTEAEILVEMSASGFKLLAWQDETNMFKGFLAGLIMNYGSMAAFWQSLVGDCVEACQIQESLKGIKIGYYLAVWQKA